MRWLQTLRLRLRSLLHRDRVDRNLERELRFHFDQQIEENVAAGMTPDEARYAAHRAFGTVAGIQEQCRDTRGLNLLDDMRWDVGYAARTLVKSPITQLP